MSVGIWWNIIQEYPYELLSTGLEHVLEEKDLGIIMDSELTFKSPIEAKLGTSNVSTLRVVILSLFIISYLHYGMSSPWQ